MNAYFDNKQNRYLVEMPNGWLALTKNDMLDRLKANGYSHPRAMDGKLISHATAKLVEIQNQNRIDMVIALAGWNQGVYEFSGKRVLVPSSPKIVPAKEGDWSLIRTCQEALFATDPRQITHWHGNSQLHLRSLLEQKPRQRMANVLVGEPGSGKTFTQERETERLGGRCANPWQHLNGVTPFNSDHFVAEHLMVSDPKVYSADDRADFSNMLKGLLFNQYQPCHAKFGEPVSLPPNWWLTISYNSEPHNQAIRNLDRSFRDKINLFLCAEKAIPPDGWKHKRPEEFLAAYRAQYSAYHWHLLHEFKIPSELEDIRTGIKAYHHPEIVSMIEDTLPEIKFLRLLEEYHLFKQGAWQGTVSELLEWLEDWKDRGDVQEVLKKRGAVPFWLSKLQAECPHRVTRNKHRTMKKRGGWTIRPDEN